MHTLSTRQKNGHLHADLHFNVAKIKRYSTRDTGLRDTGLRDTGLLVTILSPFFIVTDRSLYACARNEQTVWRKESIS